MDQPSEQRNGACDSFSQTYRCYPFSHIDKSHLETGDKIIMPVSALDRLISIRIDYPMLFQIQNPSTGRVSHCGVLEFTATEGLIFFPNWMMKNMNLNEGDDVQVKNANLPKGKYMKLQPHTTDFIRITDPKSVLEETLRRFSCVSIGDTILIKRNGKEFYVDVVETNPDSAISVIETDCEVDFALPLDYKEPIEKPKLNVTDEVAEDTKFKPFTGLARRLDGKTVMKEEQLIDTVAADGTTLKNIGCCKGLGKIVMGSNVNVKKSLPPAKKVEDERENEKGKLKAFTGLARRLDEKAAVNVNVVKEEESIGGQQPVKKFECSRKRCRKLVVDSEEKQLLKKLKKLAT